MKLCYREGEKGREGGRQRCGGSSSLPASQIASSFAPLKFLPMLDQLTWSTCSGEPQNLTLSVDLGLATCQGWTHFVGDYPDRSTPHYNSARNVRCTVDGVAYTQTPFTVRCNNTVEKNKTEHTAGCHQGIPPTVYTRVVDWSGCVA